MGTPHGNAQVRIFTRMVCGADEVGCLSLDAYAAPSLRPQEQSSILARF